jgi:aryl-alcohol dehydrogenase-like predicted oxidoreductase
MMKQRTLGRDGLTVSAIGYGAMVLSPGIYGSVDDAESVKTLHAALDHGITLIDTARLYGNGHNEALVGRAIAGRRDQVVLATKGGLTGIPPQVYCDASPAGLRGNLDASLRALGTDYVDLYYLHAPDPEVAIEDSIAEMARFVAEGKVRHLGVSNVDQDQLRRAHIVHPITACQDQYSLLYRHPEQEGRIAALRELSMALVAYSPLANGMLAGATPGVERGDMRSWMTRFTGEEGKRVAALVSRFKMIAARERLAPATLALAWLLAQGNDIVPIPGTRRATNLQASLDAVETTLSDDLLAELDGIFPAAVSMTVRF